MIRAILLLACVLATVGSDFARADDRVRLDVATKLHFDQQLSGGPRIVSMEPLEVMNEREPSLQDAASLAVTLTSSVAPSEQIGSSRPLCERLSAGVPMLMAPVPVPKTIPYRRLWAITLEIAAVQVGTVAGFTQLPGSVTGWNRTKPGFDHIARSFTHGPHLDSDHWYWNYVAHPVVGSETYLIARNRGYSPLMSLGYSAAMSAFWEFGPEAVYERASIQDLLITPAAGAILGELRYRARRALINPETGKAEKTWKKIVVVALDPIEALTR